MSTATNSRQTVIDQFNGTDVIAEAGIRRPDQFIVTVGSPKLGERNVIARYQRDMPVAITPLARELGVKPRQIREWVAAL